MQKAEIEDKDKDALRNLLMGIGGRVPTVPVRCRNCEDDRSGLKTYRENGRTYVAPCFECDTWKSINCFCVTVKPKNRPLTGIINDRFMAWAFRKQLISERIYKLSQEPPYSLFLLSPTGEGTTWLVKKWANEVILRYGDPRAVLYLDEKDLRTKFEKQPGLIRDRLRDARMIIVDEFGDEAVLADRGSRVESSIQFFLKYDRFLWHLYEGGRFQNLIIVFASNVHPAEIYNQDERGLARLRRVLTITNSLELLNELETRMEAG